MSAEQLAGLSPGRPRHAVTSSGAAAVAGLPVTGRRSTSALCAVAAPRPVWLLSTRNAAGTAEERHCTSYILFAHLRLKSCLWLAAAYWAARPQSND